MKKILALAALLFCTQANAQTLVPNLGAAGAVSDTDLMAIYQGASPLKKVTGAQIKTYANGTAVRKTTTTTEAIQDSDRNKLVTFGNASPVACTIAQAGSGGLFDSTWATSILNVNSGTVTCTAQGTSVFFGNASGTTLTLAAGQGCDLYSDGSTGYRAQCGKGGGAAPGGTSGQIQTNNGSGGFNGGNLSGDVTTSASLVTTAKGAAPINYVATNWYFAPPIGNLTGGATFTASQIYCRLYQFPSIVTVGTVGVNVTTGGGGNIQVAYYTNNGSNRPGNLLSSTASISTTTTGNKSGALGANVQVGPGSSAGRDIWICANSDNATHVLAAYNTQATGPSTIMGGPTQASISVAGNSIGLDNISCSGAACNGGVSTFGTWPTLTGTTWTYNTQVSRFPAQQFQAASVP